MEINETKGIQMSSTSLLILFSKVFGSWVGLDHNTTPAKFFQLGASFPLCFALWEL